MIFFLKSIGPYHLYIYILTLKMKFDMLCCCVLKSAAKPKGNIRRASIMGDELKLIWLSPRCYCISSRLHERDDAVPYALHCL